MPVPEQVAFLSPEWIDAFVEACAALPPRAGASATLATVVVGGPAGAKAETAYRWDLVDGRVAGAEPGGAADGAVDLLVTQPYDDAVAALRGELAVDDAFMRGRTKIAGPTASILSILPVVRSDEWRAAHEALLARTAL
jgi:hypothetical protein